MTVCVADWLAGLVLLAAVFRGGLRDWFEHSDRFRNGSGGGEGDSSESR